MKSKFEEADFNFIYSALRASLSTNSIFSIQLFQDLFSLESPGTMAEIDRINLPGLVDHKLWRLLSQHSLEEMQLISINKVIRLLLLENKRVMNVSR